MGGRTAAPWGRRTDLTSRRFLVWVPGCGNVCRRRPATGRTPQQRRLDPDAGPTIGQPAHRRDPQRGMSDRSARHGHHDRSAGPGPARAERREMRHRRSRSPTPTHGRPTPGGHPQVHRVDDPPGSCSTHSMASAGRSPCDELDPACTEQRASGCDECGPQSRCVARHGDRIDSCTPGVAWFRNGTGMSLCRNASGHDANDTSL
jgi:hypothetical protein